jgi:DNA replication and repair protein RecF
LELDYYQGWSEGLALVDVLQADRTRDFASGSTNHGAHKADIRIKLDGVTAADRLSRGQTKLLVYALKLAQATHFRRRVSQSCLFLLDDLPAELDYEHRAQVINCLNKLDCQYFMTGVDKKDFDLLVEGMAHRMFHMEHGVAVEG